MTLLDEILDAYKARTEAEKISADDIRFYILESETGFGISKSHLTFLDMKIYRGCICEKGLTEQYGIYNSVCGILREALLRCYYPIDFQLVYATAFDVFFDFLACIYNVIETRIE